MKGVGLAVLSPFLFVTELFCEVAAGLGFYKRPPRGRQCPLTLARAGSACHRRANELAVLLCGGARSLQPRGGGVAAGAHGDVSAGSAGLGPRIRRLRRQGSQRFSAPAAGRQGFERAHIFSFKILSISIENEELQFSDLRNVAT